MTGIDGGVVREAEELMPDAFCQMYSEYMINVKVRSQYLYDVPIVQTDEVLYPGPFPPEVASRVNDYRAAAFLVGQEIAVGVIRVKAFGVQEHYAL